MVEKSFPSAEGFKQATEDLPRERTGVSRDLESVLGTLGALQTQVCTICDPSWLGELGSHQLCFPGGSLPGLGMGAVDHKLCSWWELSAGSRVGVCKCRGRSRSSTGFASL